MVKSTEGSWGIRLAEGTARVAPLGEEAGEGAAADWSASIAVPEVTTSGSYLARCEGDFAGARLASADAGGPRREPVDGGTVPATRSNGAGAAVDRGADLARVDGHALGGQVGPELLLPALHLVAARGHGVADPAAGAAGHLAGRAPHLDDEGVGLEPGGSLLHRAPHLALRPQ